MTGHLVILQSGNLAIFVMSRAMMKRRFKLQDYPITKLQNSSRGYILITLMLFFTLLAISALAILPQVAQQIKREREEEMIHRGVQYTRAVQRYYKKFGRYPTRIEELESSNNLRFLRKRYKDPITGKDFKLLRLGDPALAAMGFGPGFGQGLQGVQGVQGLQAGVQGGIQGRGPGFVGAPGGGIRPAGPGDANSPQVTGLPGTVNTVQQTPTTSNAENAEESPGDSKPGDSSSSCSGSGSGFGGQVFGGGPILGVVSTSKDQSIREFNGKNHYKDWPFIYDPSSDRGGLLNTPTQPNLNQGLAGGATQGVVPGPMPQVQQMPSPQGGQQPGISNPQDNMPPEQ
jgi:type II secretory pathway pseudopilin PulG